MSHHLDTAAPALTYVDWEEAAEPIRAAGGPAKIWASFHAPDVFWFTGLHPEALDRGAGGPATMAIRTHDGTLFGITGVSMGYRGTSSGFAEQLLERIGVPDELAERIAYTRVSAVDLADPSSALHTDLWPHFNLPIPRSFESAQGAVLRVRFTTEGLTQEDGPALTDAQRLEASSDGFYQAPPATSPLRSWVELLNSPDRPDWLYGNRTVELYTTFEAAEQHGLVVEADQQKEHGWVNPLRVTQGQVQTWLSWRINPAEYHERGELGRVSEEARQALVLFGVPEKEVQQMDPATGAWDTLLHKIAGIKRKDAYRFTVQP